MNDHADIPSLPEADADALEPVAPKPRRRRAAPAEEQTGADVTAVEAKPKRRRASASGEAKPEDGESGNGSADLAAAPAPAAAAAATGPIPQHAASSAAPTVTPSAAQPDAVVSAATAVPAPVSAAPADAGSSGAGEARDEGAAAHTASDEAREAPALASAAEPQGVPAGEAADDAAGRSGRGRRRGRRHRDRGPQQGAPEAEGGSSGEEFDDEADDATVAAPAALPKVEAEVVFADVLSGAFDVATEAPAEEAAAPRRVLQPDPDAPKLQKVLAQAGIGSRRDMEELILDGQITVNGEPAHIGQRISFGDQVKVSGKPVRLRIVPPPPRLIAYHKPAGEIVTHDDPQHRPTVFRRLPRLQQGKWQSVGRLDINTEGLLLFTNSGSLANQLMHPRFGVEREYAVRVLGTLSDDAREELLEGVEIEGQEMAFRSIEEGGGDGANRWYRVVITEGRNREVRKLFDAVGLTVSRLIRIRYGSIVLPPGLKRGVWVDLDAEDVRAIRRLAGGDAPREARQGGRGNERNERNGRNNRGPRGERQDGRPNERQVARPNERQRGNRGRPADERPDDRDPDDLDFDDGPIPNPLEQTFDKRFVQNPRSPAGGRGFGRGGGGFGQGGSAPPSQNRGSGPRQPDPLQTSVGYIGGDAFHKKGKGGRGGNRGGGFGGGGGGFGGGGRRGR